MKSKPYRGTPVGEGIESKFFKINKNVGFKSFDSLKQKDVIYYHQIQTKLARFDFAPEVLSKVGKIQDKNGDLTGWGYLSEVATVFYDTNKCDAFGSGWCMRRKSCKPCKDFIEFQKSLNKYGIEMWDVHSGNFGFVRRSGKQKLVIIDMGAIRIKKDFKKLWIN